MENLELIEKYVTGKLHGPEKDAFELQLQTDTSLQRDLARQKQIINGIKSARIMELKAMLNQVPVGGFMHTGISAVKVITGAVTAGAIITGSLFYFKPWKKEMALPVVENELPAVHKNPKTEVTPVDPKEGKPSSVTSESGKEVKKKSTPSKKRNAVQPKIDVVDPTDELTKEPSHADEKLAKHQSIIVTSRIGIDVNSSSSKYSFHYQFNQGKLILYGIFDNGLYEILEVNGDTHSIFLYYKGDYYLLNEKQAAITPLTAIKDLELVKKLKEYRGR
jgi:hypothetical protein